jgi:hypothetical protein
MTPADEEEGLSSEAHIHTREEIEKRYASK